MARYVINDVTTYRVGTVDEVEQLHNELLQDPRFELTSFSYSNKTTKSKGEVTDEYYVVKAKKVFNEEKDPLSTITINYEVE